MQNREFVRSEEDFDELEKFPRKKGKERKILEGSRKRLQRERERERY